jgi:uncharacterized membrane protein YhhN
MNPLIVVPILVVTVFLLIRAEFQGARRGVYLWKPLSTLLVIAAAALSFWAANAETGYTVGVLVGLILSLGGDVALMFESDRAFLIGLVLFLLAHVAYTVVFTLFAGFHPGDLVSGAVLLALAAAAYLYLRPGLGTIKGPVSAYILIISLMVNRAISTFFSPDFTTTGAWLVALGATFFWISDLMLAVNRFRRPFEYHRLSLAFYYGGQLLIALSPSTFALVH